MPGIKTARGGGSLHIGAGWPMRTIVRRDTTNGLFEPVRDTRDVIKVELMVAFVQVGHEVQTCEEQTRESDNACREVPAANAAQCPRHLGDRDYLRQPGIDHVLPHLD